MGDSTLAGALGTVEGALVAIAQAMADPDYCQATLRTLQRRLPEVRDALRAHRDTGGRQPEPVGYLCARPVPEHFEIELLGVVSSDTSMTNLYSAPRDAAAVRALYQPAGDRQAWPVLALVPVEGA